MISEMYKPKNKPDRNKPDRNKPDRNKIND